MIKKTLLGFALIALLTGFYIYTKNKESQKKFEEMQKQAQLFDELTESPNKGKSDEVLMKKKAEAKELIQKKIAELESKGYAVIEKNGKFTIYNKSQAEKVRALNENQEEFAKIIEENMSKKTEEIMKKKGYVIAQPHELTAQDRDMIDQVRSNLNKKFKSPEYEKKKKAEMDFFLNQKKNSK